MTPYFLTLTMELLYGMLNSNVAEKYQLCLNARPNTNIFLQYTGSTQETKEQNEAQPKHNLLILHDLTGRAC